MASHGLPWPPEPVPMVMSNPKVTEPMASHGLPSPWPPVASHGLPSPRFSLQGFPLPLCGARNLRRAGEPWKGKSSPTSTVVNPVKRAKHLLSAERASEIPKPMALTPPFGGHSRLSKVPAFAAAPGERTRIHYIRGKSVNGFQTSLLVNGS